MKVKIVFLAIEGIVYMYICLPLKDISINFLPHYPDFNDPKEGFGKHFGKKRDNAGNQHFLIFPQCFPPRQKERNSHFSNLDPI